MSLIYRDVFIGDVRTRLPDERIAEIARELRAWLRGNDDDGDSEPEIGIYLPDAMNPHWKVRIDLRRQQIRTRMVHVDGSDCVVRTKDFTRDGVRRLVEELERMTNKEPVPY